jgi:hypothetical protein
MDPAACVQNLARFFEHMPRARGNVNVFNAASSSPATLGSDCIVELVTARREMEGRTDPLSIVSSLARRACAFCTGT